MLFWFYLLLSLFGGGSELPDGVVLDSINQSYPTFEQTTTVPSTLQINVNDCCGGAPPPTGGNGGD